jgi:hypothetical protein
MKCVERHANEVHNAKAKHKAEHKGNDLQRMRMATLLL